MTGLCDDTLERLQSICDDVLSSYPRKTTKGFAIFRGRWHNMGNEGEKSSLGLIDRMVPGGNNGRGLDGSS